MDDSQYATEHSLVQQRYYILACLVYGSNPEGCESASKSDPIERQPRRLNSRYKNTLARILTDVCRDPVSPPDIKLIQYVISYRVGSRLVRRSTLRGQANDAWAAATRAA
ncbi:DUF4344 domain-containing metallopeptidase [Brevundimonas sp. TWP2-3-2]|uniref:DUF4344 domain-containing metallopeptidase n=1 Tax=unclassified Brevundimonas TaxID=2622653 RepID=UPI003CF2FCA4